MADETRSDPPPSPLLSARDRVLDALRRAIITLRLAPGTPVSEKDLAAELAVSRTPVRESVILLRAEGLVEVYPQVGTFVAPVDLERVRQAQFIREAVECTSLEQADPAAARGRTGELRALLASQREAGRAGDHDRFFDLDEEFHRALLALAGNLSAWGTVNAAKAHLDRARRLSLIDTRPIGELVEQHTGIVDAIEAEDTSAAVAALRAHLRTVFEDVERIRAASPDLFSEGPRRPVRRTVTTLG
ncbi:GntR family transcriptional regulator [Nocardiopsis sp. RSe5-2]|uniref:GntR family transcriptional regulator n=1 Tax=Nocardiopsis endophytica TaxID=3018445 RepID=A0ABT4U6A0_9ACTN|nr:GntR family transcriptional regulator [Nocardiopsis endophytica]MDA2811887.1 GntR family transcriptional regulator [Nocardiopsis endophytica]